MKPTPGPWRLATEWSDEHGMRHDCAAVDADTGNVTDCLRMYSPLAEDQANAALIVAAVNPCFASERPLDFAAQIPAMVERAKDQAGRECANISVVDEDCGYLYHDKPHRWCEPCHSRALLASAGIEWRET
jgi:hypothetical protein